MPMKNPPHPGLGLKDDFDELGLSLAQAADALGISRSQLHRVVAGKSDISAELALRLEVVIGGTGAIAHRPNYQRTKEAAYSRGACPATISALIMKCLQKPLLS